MAFSAILLVILAVLFFILFLKILKSSIKIGVKLLVNAAIGFVLLFAINFVGKMINFSLPVTFWSCVWTGFTGTAGVIILAALKLLGIIA